LAFQLRAFFILAGFSYSDYSHPMTQPQLATFGAGCFWGTEAALKKLPGILKVEVGYIGGSTERPSYEDVIAHGTGHVEVVQATFDPAQVTYDQLLQLFWLVHNPTQGNRQGNDVGDQYRSVIFYHSDEQKQLAEASKAALGAFGQYSDPITTGIEPATTFWKAEDYHQDYLAKNPGGYCHVNMGKVNEFITKTFGDKKETLMITYDDFAKLDIRLGTVTSAERIEGADKLLKLMIDLGMEKRQIVAGIAQVVSDPAELVGKQLPILCNLEPRTLRGVESQGMMLAAGDENDLAVLLHPAYQVTNGSQIR
jgi:peptide-methionine (S)-S-oxide reductase